MEKTFIGLDISKQSIDVYVKKPNTCKNAVILNELKAIKAFLKPFNEESVVIAMENTGRYNFYLFEVLSVMKCKVFVLNPLHLKKSLGLVRGKSDKVDAERICIFIEKNESSLKQWVPTAKNIQKLKILLTVRNQRVKMKSQYLASEDDHDLFKSLNLDTDLRELNAAIVKKLEEQIACLEQKIQQLINNDIQLKSHYDMATSVPGVGKILCWNLIAKTEGFTILNDPRKLACYCGVVPFEHQSGTSLRGRTRVSPYADKTLKKILHLAAMSAIRLNNDLRSYYVRKVAEGKNKMSVLNAVRNKIIHRVLAVIKAQKNYEFT